MRRKTNRLLLLLISTALAACSSQSERGSSGLEVESTGEPAQITSQPPAPAPAEPAYQPEPPTVQYIDAPLPETTEVDDLGPLGPVETVDSPPAETTAADSGISAPTVYPEEFPVTTYEMPPEPDAEAAAIEDLGPLGPVDTIESPPAQTAALDSGISAPTEFAEEFPITTYEMPPEPDEPIEDLGPIGPVETIASPPAQLAQRDSGISAPQYPVEEAPAEPAAITIEMQAEPLFAFDKYNIRSDERQKIDQFVAKLNGTEYETVWAIGHADRIGTVEYNQKLSERRANSIKAYLVRLGVPANKIRTLGRSEHNPLTQESDCKGLRRKELIACYQPDRRVEISVSGQRTASAQ